MSQLNVDKIVSLSGGGSTAEFQLASNGNFNFDSGTFYIDSANNRVGIGTSSPRVSVDMATTDSMIVPKGTTNERPGSPVEGMFRYNSTDRTFEGYALNESTATVEWGPIAGAGGIPAQSTSRYSDDYSVNASLKSDGT